MRQLTEGNMNDDMLQRILHDLEHQKLEAIGVEQLAKDTIPFMMGILMAVRFTNLSVPQIIATLRTIAHSLSDGMCAGCQDFANRIEKEMNNDFKAWLERSSKE